MYTKTANSNLYIISLLLVFNLTLLSVNAQTYSVCKGDSISLDLAAYRGNLQWQESDDNVVWGDISGATNQPYIIKISTNKYYRAKITDGSCNPVYSAFTEVTINPSACAYVCGQDGTFIDARDGQTYGYVNIGTQRWMCQNLNATKYLNGDTIPDVIDKTAWVNLTTGAYCNYNNDANNSITYGRLYNWYAVNDSRKLCPSDWHIPSHDEWTTLESAICKSGTCNTDFPYDATTVGWRGTNEGGNLKETGTTNWTSSNIGATNSSGFTALGGGYRDYYFGLYSYLGSYGEWWSITKGNSTNAWARHLWNGITTVNRSLINQKTGLSVRCIKN